jgi:hypothetical protein
MFTV